jgi:hypothetical protein
MFILEDCLVKHLYVDVLLEFLLLLFSAPNDLAPVVMTMCLLELVRALIQPTTLSRSIFTQIGLEML